ncbi:hypothetical protein GWI33_022207 [Rhynchophorus ferrugineus]|uniref:Uncharacterized protein n=1 Tax=Rhynchophorus ferrugineus TaxID=354439 RepID=A0A834INN7_RHYFE|nr:hypothetical protein GWI33_022207 [Rhynchophorus ferrugineus]
MFPKNIPLDVIVLEYEKKRHVKRAGLYGGEVGGGKKFVESGKARLQPERNRVRINSDVLKTLTSSGWRCFCSELNTINKCNSPLCALTDILRGWLILYEYNGGKHGLSM